MSGRGVRPSRHAPPFQPSFLHPPNPIGETAAGHPRPRPSFQQHQYPQPPPQQQQQQQQQPIFVPASDRLWLLLNNATHDGSSQTLRQLQTLFLSGEILPRVLVEQFDGIIRPLEVLLQMR